MMNWRKTLSARWQARSDREQILLVAMAALTGLVLLYLLAARPLLGVHEMARQDYAGAMRLYRGIEADVARYDALRDGVPETAGSEQSLRSIVGSLALRHDIAIARLIPSGEGELTLNIDRAEVRAVMAWLVELEAGYGIQVTSSTIDRLGDDFVELHLVLRRRSA
ncbi:MAG: general secretion pathway protein M [Maricaulis sp.]|jgi:general secretion pathway protein M